MTSSSTVTGNQTDPNLPNSAVETTAVVAETDLTVTKSDFPDPVVAGGSLAYTLTVTNQGPSDATEVAATDALPPEVSLVSTSPDCTVAGRVVTCTAGNLAAGAGTAFTITTAVDPATAPRPARRRSAARPGRRRLPGRDAAVVPLRL